MNSNLTTHDCQLEPKASWFENTAMTTSKQIQS